MPECRTRKAPSIDGALREKRKEVVELRAILSGMDVLGGARGGVASVFPEVDAGVQDEARHADMALLDVVEKKERLARIRLKTDNDATTAASHRIATLQATLDRELNKSTSYLLSDPLLSSANDTLSPYGYLRAMLEA